MMYEYATARLVKASLVCGAITNLSLALFVALSGRFGAAAFVVVMMPLAVVCYALGLALFGVPLLYLWPSAFKRGAGRGLAATAIGAIAAQLALSIDWRSLPELRFSVGETGSVVLVVFFGAIAGFVWWWLNRGFAEPEKDVSDEA